MVNLTYVGGLEWLGTKGAEDAIELPSNIDGRQVMPQGDKDKYSDKQKRKAEHIEEGYEERGVGHKEAQRRAWATVNKESGAGNKSGSGRGKKDSHESARKGGHKGGSSQSSAKRSAAAKKGWETRRKRGNG